MPSPSSALSTLRPDLASMAEFGLADQEFIGHRVLPVMQVGRETGVFGKVKLADILQKRNTARAPGAGYNRGKFVFEPATYACEEHGAEEPVDDREATIYADYLDAEAFAAMRARMAILVEAEKRIEALLYNTTTWTGASLTTTVTNEWDDAANATPIVDVKAAAEKVYDGTGLWPNALIISRKVFRNLRKVDEIEAQLAASGAGFPNRARDVTPAQLSEVFDLDFILVGGGSENTANEGQTPTPSQIWSGEYAMVAKIAVSNDIREPCVGRTFHFAGDGSDVDGMVEEYREEAVRSNIIRVRHDVDELVLYKEAAHLLQNITT